nr:haloacid dehalogenase-like hydrolase [Arthrospira sp. PLM2.Bin9]
METIDPDPMSMELQGKLVIVDLDETLLLRNSTEEYLNSLQPQILGAVLLIALDILKPWNWLPGHLKGDQSRDWCRVIISTLIFPWTLIFWQHKAKKLAHDYINQELILKFLEQFPSKIVIATLGFDLIINPIINNFQFCPDAVISCRFWQGGVDRQRGKYELVKAVLTDEEIANAAVITDSTDDQVLLDAVASPYLVQWPDAQYVPAMADAYIPFLYLERGKRPGQKYFIKNIIADDWLVLILAIAWISPYPALQSIMMLFLLLSFWCIYEYGYVDNDIIAETFEQKPTLTATYQKYKNRVHLSQVWLWAIILATPGLFLLEVIKLQLTSATLNLSLLRSMALDGILWLTFLGLVFGLFWSYNRLDKQTRIWLYFGLQASKCFGFLMVTTTNSIGIMLFASQVLARWIAYIVYRVGKHSEWIDFPGELFRCFLFTFLMISVALGTGELSILLSWQTLVIFAWCAYRGRKQFVNICRQAYPIYKDKTVV